MRMKTCLLLILGSLLFSVGATAAPKRICTMTLNSENEREVLRSLYAGSDVEVTELVPANKDPQWLQKACQSGIECDVLLVSGHFGGVFFGEGVSTTLDLKEIEKLSCENACPGILNKPKDVFLMGCNTLATKVPDKRSIEEYVEVLIKNGFPRDLAERVAFSRYSDYGMSISQIFSSAFPQAERLHGFSSTGPMGRVAGPMMRRALKDISKETFFTKGPNIQKFKDVFAGTSYRIVEPKKEMDPNYRHLACKTYSKDTTHNKEAIEFISQKTNLKKYYEPLLEASENPSFLAQLQNTVLPSPEITRNFENFFAQISSAKSLPMKMQFQFLELQAKLGLMPEMVKREQQEKLIRQRLANGLNFIITDQLCTMKDHLKNIELKGEWIKLDKVGIPFMPRVAQCFGSYDTRMEDLLKAMATMDDPSWRREAVRALAPRLTPIEVQDLLIASSAWPVRDHQDILYTLNQKQQDPLPPMAQHCMLKAKRQDTADSRDGYRWGCYKEFEHLIDTPAKCHQVADQFETNSVSGIDWNCLTRFNSKIHLGACMASADRNQDPENSDDIRWYCWSKLQNQNQLSRSECLALASSMRIQGNRFKANWNCMNRL